MGVAAIGHRMHSDEGDLGVSAPHDTGYRIERTGSADKPWVITFGDNAAAPLGLLPRDSGKAYPSLRVARAAATHLEVLRERRIKFVRHVVLAILWAIVAVTAYRIMAAPDQPLQLEWFAVALVAVFFFLNETLEGFLVAIDEGWDRFYEIRSVSRTDRIIARAIFFARAPLTRSSVDADSHSVRVIDR